MIPIKANIDGAEVNVNVSFGGLNICESCNDVVKEALAEGYPFALYEGKNGIVLFPEELTCLIYVNGKLEQTETFPDYNSFMARLGIAAMVYKDAYCIKAKIRSYQAPIGLKF